MHQRPSLRNPRLLRCLHYFEAVARLRSVARAAEEIGVSSSAVSHQLRELSALLGEGVVVKAGRGIALTAAGQRLAARLGEAFSDLDRMVSEVVGQGTQRLRVAVCSSFGPAWLSPRLPALARAHPEIDLELRLYTEDPEQTQGVADAIITARPVKPGFQSIALMDELLVAVRKAGSHGPTRLITTDLEDSVLGRDWKSFASLGGHVEAEGGYLRCTHYLLALSMAKSGMGAALVPDFLAAEGLADGSLTLCDTLTVPAGRTYRMCFKNGRSQEPAVRAMAQWIKAQISRNPAALRSHAQGSARKS